MSLRCPTDGTLARMIEGDLDEVSTSDLRAHLDGCRSCLRVVAALRTAPRTEEASSSTGPRAAAPPAPALARGAVVSRYLVLDKIGEGGMGAVFAAYDPELDRKIALKVLRGDVGGQRDDLTARLLREARALARISHPNVIAIHDVGVFGDTLFLAMDLIQGGTLTRTLAQRPRPALAELLPLFISAGAGLAAAHAAGLVHRDFKPDNVLLGEGGRVLVTDFGLVRWALGAATTTADPPLTAAGLTTTHAGARLGTPAYMAPEQHAGGAVDARTDQFAFSVALYEALYGVRPFAGRTVAELAAAVLAGAIREPPAGARVPPSIADVVRRGLSVRAEDRFPSMEALLEALRKAAAPRGRRRAAGLALAAGTLLLALAHQRSTPAAAPPPCHDAAQGMARVWNDERRARVVAAFEATRLPFAAEGARGVVGELDARAAAWVAARADACEATRVRGEQSERMLDLRAACLDRRAHALDGLVTLLERADAELVTRGVDAVRALPKLDACAPSELASPIARPTSADAELRVADVETRLAALEARAAAGRFADLEADAAAVVEEARAAGHAPLLADALSLLASAQSKNEHAAASERTLYECLWAAEAGHADRVAASAWVGLVYAVSYKQLRFDEEAQLVRHAEAAIQRVGGDPEIETRLLGFRGGVAYAAGKWDLVASRFQEVFDRVSGSSPDEAQLLFALHGLALAEQELGQFGKALDHERRTLALLLRTRGAEHPDVATSLEAEAHALWSLGRYEEALVEARRALAIREAAFGPGNPWIAFARHNVASVLSSAGRADEALGEATLALTEATAALGPTDPRMGILRAERARALLLLGRLDEATAEAARALALCRDASGLRHPDGWVCDRTAGAAYLARGDFTKASARYRAIAEESASSRGGDHPYVALGLTGLGRAELGLGQVGLAREHLERALAIQDGREGDPSDRAETELALADALWRTGESRDRASALAHRAREAYAAAGHAKLGEEAAAEAWLTAHDRAAPAPP